MHQVPSKSAKQRENKIWILDSRKDAYKIDTSQVQISMGGVEDSLSSKVCEDNRLKRFLLQTLGCVCFGTHSDGPRTSRSMFHTS